jgi:glycosyltransferase involved in cell wall biosynthesis
MPTVSVVLPTYNRSNILPRAIGSVLQQTFGDYELIIVDDASTDNTEQVVNRYDDSRITFLSHSTNKGGSAARNTGIDNADGKYIAFLDSDDEWLPRKLEKQLSELQSRPSNWVATYCGFRTRHHKPINRVRRQLSDLLFDDEENVCHKEGGEALIPVILTMDLPLGGSSNLFVKSKTVHKIGGFDNQFQRHQDYEFLIRLLKEGDLAYTEDVLTIKHEYDSPSAEKIEAGKRELFEKFRDDIQRAESEGHKIVDTHMRQLMRLYCSEGQFNRAYEYYRKCDEVDTRGLIQLYWASIIGVVRRSKSVLERNGW